MRLETLRQKRKEREREMVVLPAAPPKRQWLRPPVPSSLPPPREVDMSALEFLFEKRLRHSDVKDRGRVVIPKEFAVKHFPEIGSKEGIYMSMDDVTRPKLWTFRYGFWSNTSGRVHVLEHACEFFAMHGLQNGDFLMFYIDRQVGRFVSVDVYHI
ncbi:B3 domain-containing transcription factor FUS3-like [Primulina huaijiensis]|uniref:B3 domain-containing transcription factor FUS3-like n=1 Tax=Primulina huaijiensis TaxID=1492673 RepID=UPI003CC791FD